ncbi:VIT1/CCC1 transporter family protein [Prosthecobacter sp.]|jgi:VIT1/CCC1 family predicted Fe2+/Mn2+ transporter|uniref:VIT1/CCC1 transporter family protein n=1 Tax=Prosthecobacter sp. TaxID=1965333 RepID=UPI0037CBABC6
MLPQLHFDHSHIASGTMRDIIIGTADGLTVPFVLASGVSGAIDSAHVVVTAGLAQVAAGAIAMGLSGYIAATDEAERYECEILREDRPVLKVAGPAATPIADLLKPYGVTDGEAAMVAKALHRKPKACRKFILRFKHGLQAPDPKRPLRSALTIGCSYVLCGMIPLMPYMIVSDLHQALLISLVATLLALAVFGFVKGQLTGISRFRCAWQTALIGSLAAGIAFSLAKIIS